MKTNRMAAPNHFNAFQINNYTVETRQWEGQSYLVAPVVLMTEGVHHGSGGPIFYPAEELSRFPSSWNGRPLPVQHPQDGVGNFVSANTPDVLTNWNVGQLYNVHWDADNRKLRGEIWVNIERAERISPEVLDHLHNRRPLEVSTGLFSEDEMTSGVWNGETYTAIARNIRSDHLALLPGNVGACSYADGCGVRANSRGGEDPMKINLKKGDQEFTALCGIGEGNWLERISARLLKNNAQGFREIGEKLQRKLDSMDGPQGIHWLEEFFTNDLIYRVNRDGEVAMYRVNYTIDNAGQVEFVGEPQQVRRDVNFIDVNQDNPDNQDNSNGERVTVAGNGPCTCGSASIVDNTNEEEHMKRNEVVEALRANKRIVISDDVAETLVGLESCEEFATQIGDLIAANAKQEEANAEAPAGNEDAAVAEGTVAEAPDVNAFIDSAPEGIRDMLRSGVKAHEDARAALVSKIKSNKANTFSDAQLGAMGMDQLEGIAALASVPEAPAAAAQPASYVGAGGAAPVANHNAPEPLAAPTMNFANADK